MRGLRNLAYHSGHRCLNLLDMEYTQSGGNLMLLRYILIKQGNLNGLPFKLAAKSALNGGSLGLAERV